mgnify:CR=1 FL=1
MNASAPSERSVRAVWRTGWVVDIACGDFALTADEPSTVPGGTDQGPQPTELLLAAVSSCFAMALSHAARKRSVEIDGLVVEATGYYEGPSFSAIRVTAVVGCDESQLAGLMSSAERFCYVTNTLRGGVDLTFEGILGPPVGGGDS